MSISARKDMVSAATYSKHFLSLDMEFQNMFHKILERIRKSVAEQLNSIARLIEKFEDYFVLNDSLSILVQPSLPVDENRGPKFGYDEI